MAAERSRQLQRLGEGGTVAPLPCQGGAASSLLGGGPQLATSSGYDPGDDECVGLGQRRWCAHRLVDSGLRLIELAHVDQQLGQTDEGRHEALQVADLPAGRDRLLVGGTRLRHIATDAMHVAQAAEGVGDHARPGSLVGGDGGGEIPSGLVEATEVQEHLGAVRKRQSSEGWKATHLGQTHRLVQLCERLLVASLLEVMRAPVGPNADDLKQVVGCGGVLERTQVVSVVGGSVAIERGQQCQRGVGRCQSLAVAARPRQSLGLGGQLCTAISLTSQPAG